METHANLVKIGVFVLAVIIAGFAGAFWLLKGDQKGPRAQLAIVFQGSVGGLLPGAAVSFNGVKVGEVSKVTFGGDDPNRMVALLAVDAGAPIRKDSTVALGFSGLTGYATVQIVGGTAGSPRVLDQKDGVPELNADAGSVQDLMQGAKRIMGRVDDTLGVLDKLVKDNGPAITNVIHNAETFSNSIAKNADNIDKFMVSIGDAANVLSKVSVKIEKLSDDVDGIVTSVNKDQVKQIVANAAKVSDDLAKSTGNLQDIATDFRATAADARKVVAAIDPIKVSSMLDDASKLSKYLTGKTAEFDDLLTHARSISKDVDTFTSALSKKTPEVSKLVDDTASAMHQIEVASHRIDGILAKVDGVVGSDAGKGMFDQGRTFLTEATEAAKAFKETSQIYGSKANEITASIRDLVVDGRKTLNSLDRAVTDFNRNPQQLIFGNSHGNVPEYGPGRR